MGKVHGNAKRKFNSARHLSTARPETRHRKRRQKTFKSENAAREWAQRQGITKFTLHNLRISEKDQKIRVVPQE